MNTTQTYGAAAMPLVFEKTLAVFHRTTENGVQEAPHRHEIAVRLADAAGSGAWALAGLTWVTERPADDHLAGQLEEYALGRARILASGSPGEALVIAALAGMDILEYLGKMGVETRRAGREFKALCPFHHETDPSFFVNAEKGLWICRGACSRGGSIVDLIMLAEGVSLREAIARAGQPSTCRRPVPVARQDPLTAEVTERLTRVAKRYEEALDASVPARLYLTRDRGLEQATVYRHHLGLCPEHGDREPPVGDGQRPALAGHVVIPEFHQGRCIYLLGRRLAPGEPKYMGLHGLPKPLYGFSRFAREPLLYLVEGPFDWLSLLQWGLPAVAALGTHLSPAQTALLAGKRLVLCQDADDAGDLAAAQVARVVPNSRRLRPPRPFKDWSEALSAGWKREDFARHESESVR